jgi:F-type H+-transporting ATPase subunit c
MEYKLLGAGIAMVGTLGAGIGLGLIFSAWISAIARNPSAEKKFQTWGLVGFAATELVLLMCFVVAMMLMNVK